MKKTISILGAGGKMGKWFAKYFLENGFEVTGFDSENPAGDILINLDLA